MDTAFHYLLMASQALFQRRVMAALADTGLTAGQPKVLDYLGLHDGSIQKAIAAGCLIEPATLTGLLNRMEEKGLITRRAAENDRRICRIHLTETGRAAQARVRAALTAAADELLADLPAETRSVLTAGLRHVCLRLAKQENLQ